jgi:hypothetical protein
LLVGEEENSRGHEFYGFGNLELEEAGINLQQALYQYD